MKLSHAVITRAFLASLALFCHAYHAGAQTRAAPGVIDGMVTDTNFVALGDATVSVLSTSIHVVTGANGRFRILGLPGGHYIVMVRRLGYESASTMLEVTGGDTLRTSFALERVAIKLDTMKATAPFTSMRLSEFEERRKLGVGHFMTQAEIEARNTLGVLDLLQPLVSVKIQSSGSGQYAMSMRGPKRLTLEPCPFQVFVDGVAVMPIPVNLNNLPSPKELAGMEVYSGGATIPLQYKRADSGCGVILLWTRSGP